MEARLLKPVFSGVKSNNIPVCRRRLLLLQTAHIIDCVLETVQTFLGTSTELELLVYRLSRQRRDIYSRNA